MNKDKWARYQPRVWFIGILLFGVVLLFVAEYWLGGRAREITIGVGISFVTAAIIGGVIEIAFVSRIAREVFHIAFGYLLRPEIRKEITWIYEMDKLVTDYSHQFTIEKHNKEGKVWVYETITRTVKNIGNKSQDVRPSLGIEEWFHAEGRSEIIDYQITFDSGETFSLKNRDIVIERPKKHKQANYILAIKEEKLSKDLASGKTYTWAATCRELRSESADTVSFWGTASMNPHITVQVPEHMDYDLTFANRKQGELRDWGNGMWRLNTVLLPGQAIRLRWWPKSDSATWQREIDEKYQKKA